MIDETEECVKGTREGGVTVVSVVVLFLVLVVAIGFI